MDIKKIFQDIFNIKSPDIPYRNDKEIVAFEESKPGDTNKGDWHNPDFHYLWAHCLLDDTKNVRDSLAFISRTIFKNKSRYEQVQKLTGVPWYFTAAIHCREASFNFNSCLHNGDPLDHITVNVPKGRGPFLSWEAGATDALKLRNLDKIKVWTVETALEEAEKFNGLGYRKKGEEYSPYIWAGTNWSDETGKFVVDGKYDPKAPEKQMGIAAIFKSLGL